MALSMEGVEEGRPDGSTASPLSPRPSPEFVLDRLSRIDLLAALPPEEVQTLVPFVECVTFTKGEVIFSQGDVGDALYLIEDGQARVLHDAGADLGTLAAGETFGEMALLTGEPRTASLVAESDLLLWRLWKEDFDDLIQGSPRLEAALQELAEKHRAGLPLAARDPAVRHAWFTAALRALAARSLGLAGLRAAEQRLAAAIERKRANRDVNRIHDERLTPAQRLADRIAATMGSWPFIIGQSLLLLFWVALNVTELIWKAWDPYPFILMNLLLSLQAAYAAPMILMSQNRQATKDRLHAELDLRTNLHAEALIEEIHGAMEDLRLRQWRELVELQERQIELLHGLASPSSGRSDPA